MAFKQRFPRLTGKHTAVFTGCVRLFLHKEKNTFHQLFSFQHWCDVVVVGLRLPPENRWLNDAVQLPYVLSDLLFSHTVLCPAWLVFMNYINVLPCSGHSSWVQPMTDSGQNKDWRVEEQSSWTCSLKNCCGLAASGFLFLSAFFFIMVKYT